MARLDDARFAIQEGIAQWFARQGHPELADLADVDVPTETGHGDLTTSVCLRAAKPMRTAPQALAQPLAEFLRQSIPMLASVEAAGPGFLNFTLQTPWLAQVVNDIRVQGPQYGHNDAGQGQRVLIEFVSANPTGPLVIVSGRAAAVGDAMARIMNVSGYHADREFYVNNAGNQIGKLGHAIFLRIQELQGHIIEEWPEGVYPGEYVIEVARQYLKEHPAFVAEQPTPDTLWMLGQYGAEVLRSEQEQVLKTFGVTFEHWTFEKDLRDQQAPEHIVQRLEDLGVVQEAEGAKWFMSTRFGDDKDRVLVKSDGTYTYFVPDAAYHAQKFERGYDWVIDLLGPDHHGYIGRMRALVTALGYAPDHFDVMIIQLVRLVRDGELVRMSKRGGQFVALADLIEEVGVDAARFFFLERAPNTPMDFDLGLAELKSNDNPVFYIQYAAARIHSVLRQWRESVHAELIWEPALLSQPLERRLLFVLARYPDIVRRAALDRAPQYLPKYLTELAQAFHSFYRQHRILDEAPAVTMARVALCEATLSVLSLGLGLLGISVPEHM
ncbi:MAG: arginine--tRNA ligase [Sulfobacillus thermosulfidooxidans]|nr:MAG: arginine--tRNA ligase [Sulfobacillus thermosulfidooxidans]